MPKYLALDYVAKALQHRQSQVERMQVAAPHHIEFVDAYIHKGEVTDCEYRSPWDHLDEFSHSNDRSFLLLTTDENIQADFYQLCSDLCDTGYITHNLERFHMSPLSTTRQDEEDFDNFGSDDELFLLSQDIDLAIQRFLPTCDTEGVNWSDSTTGEVFSTYKLKHERLTLDTDTVDEHLLELPETTEHFECLLDAVPSVDDLAKRLKPKMIQDPLLDASGQPYSYETMFSDEYHMVTSPEVSTEKHHLHLPFEEFDHHILSHNDSNDLQDLILEVEHDESSPATNEGRTLSLVDANDTQAESLPRNFREMEDESKVTQQSTEDLKTLATHFSAPTPTKLSISKLTHFSPADLRNLGSVELTKLNNGPSESCDSEDSGLGYAYLESPILPPPFTSLTSSPLTKQLGQLEPLPLSPEGKIRELTLLSPNSEELLLSKILETDNVFDPVLALTIPYPTNEDGIIDVATRDDTVCELIQMMELKPISDTNEDSESEELAWDPLVDSYEEMVIAQHGLVTLAPLNFEPLELGGWDIEELFEKDEYVELKNKDEGELPLDRGEMMEATKKKRKVMEVFESDIPSIRLQSGAPSGYPKTSSTSLLTNQSPQPPTSNDVTNDYSPSDMCAASSAWKISNSTSLTKPPPLYNMNLGVDSLLCTKSTNDTTIAHRDSKSPTTYQWGSGTSSRLGGSGSALDDFMLLRFSGSGASILSSHCGGDNGSDGLYSLGRKRMMNNIDDSVGPNPKRAALNNTDHDAELVIVENMTAPVFQDVYFTGEFQSSLLKIEGFSSSLLTALRPYGFQSPRGGVRQLCPDTVKFFLKQQQKKMMDSNEAVDILKSCQLSASLYIVCTVLDLLTHCTLGVGLGRFSSLYERYGELIGNHVDFVKQELLSLQLASKDTSSSLDPHPKLREMVGVVCRWMKTVRKSWREKAVVVVEREFNSLSGEILDFLQSIPNIKSCVFSFASDEDSNSLYLKAVEERFHHYDCLVVPTTSLTDHTTFPWEKVTLLIEYEQLRQPLFPKDTSEQDNFRDGGPSMSTHEKFSAHSRQEGNVVDRLKLKEYVTLRSVWELGTTAAVLPTTEKAGSEFEGISQLQYTLIASENITNNTQLLQLMETRYNILIIPRDYPSSTVSTISRRKPSKKLNYVDLIVDQSTGILLRPLSLLCVDSGARALIGTLTALSLQYETCWLLLYTEGEHNYPFRGNVQTNLARLYASVATYSPRLDKYWVKILTLFSIEEVAKITRRIAEEAHMGSKVWSLTDWTDRGWLNEDMSKSERILLSFPCMNSFSAQCVLREFTVGDVMSMEIDQLKSNFPWMPTKVVEFFYKMCHSSAIAEECADVSPSLPTSTATSNEMHTNTENERRDQTTLKPTERNSVLWNRDCDKAGSVVSQPSANTDVIMISNDDDQESDPGFNPEPQKKVSNTLNWRKKYQEESTFLTETDLPDSDIDLVVISDDEREHEQDFSPHNVSGSYFAGDQGVCDPNSSISMYGLDHTLRDHSLDDSLEGCDQVDHSSKDTSAVNLLTVSRSNLVSDSSAQSFEMHPDSFQMDKKSDDSFVMFEAPDNSRKNDFIDLTRHEVSNTSIADFQPQWPTSVNHSSLINDKNLKKVSFIECSTNTSHSKNTKSEFSDFLSTSSSSHASSFSHHTPFSLCNNTNNRSNTFNPPLPASTLPKHPTQYKSTDYHHSMPTKAPTSSTMHLFSSSQRLGKTPTQKQIRETVMRDIVLSNSDPSTSSMSNKARLAREYYTGPPPASFMASSAVRNTPNVQRTPVKALDLGIGKGVRESAFRLKSNDRIFGSTSSSNSRDVSRHNALLNRCLGFEQNAGDQPYYDRQKERAETNTRHSLFQPQTGSSVTNGFGIKGRPAIRGANSSSMSGNDLKAFHQRQVSSEKPSSTSIFPAASMKSGIVRCSDQLADPWSGRDRIGTAATGIKRPYFGTQHTQPHVIDSLVPTVSPTSPPSARVSLYGSPNGTILTSSSSSGVWPSQLSPLRKRRLICQKDNSSCDGQTRLRFQ